METTRLIGQITCAVGHLEQKIKSGVGTGIRTRLTPRSLPESTG